MRQYTDTTSVELFLSDATAAGSFDIHNSFSVQISVWIDQMSKFIEEETGHQFIADTTASVKLYEMEYEDANEVGRYSVVPKYLNIDEAVDVTKLEVKGGIDDDFVTVDIRYWLKYPANKVPYVRLFIDSKATTQFKIGQQNIKVTGKWGYSVACPEDIKFAATVLVAGVLQYSHRHQGQQSSLTMGRYQVAYKNERQLGSFEQAKQILARYKKNSIV